MPEEPPFIVQCDDCEMDCKTHDLGEALTFAVKHKQHTDHSITWEHNDLVDGVISIPKRIRWKVECDVCGTTRIFREQDQAEQFCDDHEVYTDHSSPAPEKVTFPAISELTVSDFEAVLDHCFEQAETVDVVPTEAVLEAFEEAGVSRERTAKELTKVEARTDTYHLGEGLLAR